MPRERLMPYVVASGFENHLYTHTRVFEKLHSNRQREMMLLIRGSRTNYALIIDLGRIYGLNGRISVMTKGDQRQLTLLQNHCDLTESCKHHVLPLGK